MLALASHALVLAIPIHLRLMQVLEAHGYPVLAAAVFLQNFGLPVPAEAMLLAAAGLTRSGQLTVPLVYAVGTMSAVIGDNLGFYLGLRLGRDVLTQRLGFLLTPKRVAGVDQFLERWGARVIFFVRFIPGVSTVSAVLAGSSTLTWRRYLLGEVPGVLTWAAVICALGFYGSAWGDRLRPIWAGVHHTTWVVLAGLVVFSLVGRVLLRIRARGS